MKKTFSLLVLLIFGMIFFVACSKPADHTEYVNFRIIDESTYIHDDNSLNYLEKDTYMVVSLNKNEKLPETLIVPDEYNGKKVTAIGSNLLDGANIKTLVLPQSIKLVGSNLCGSGCNCPMLEKIVCLGYSPFYLGSFAFDTTQLRGGCKIYVPDEVVEEYKSFNEGAIDLAEYKDLIFPYSELDEKTKEYIEKNTTKIPFEEYKLKATFKVNGITVAERFFKIGDTTIQDLPKIADSECATGGTWEEFELGVTDIVINAQFKNWHHTFDNAFSCVYCNATPKSGDILTFGLYEQDGDISNGKENLEWIVLESCGNELMLITKYAIAGRQYTVDTGTNWKKSLLRGWLNNAFIDEAFNSTESKLLLEKFQNRNYDNDKVTLLSSAETAFEYGDDNSGFFSSPTQYAILQGVQVNENGNCECWLWPNESYSSSASFTMFDGYNAGCGEYELHKIKGVRPVIYIDISGR